jgi:DNA polymerase III epsilon subunit-like protein
VVGATPGLTWDPREGSHRAKQRAGQRLPDARASLRALAPGQAGCRAHRLSSSPLKLVRRLLPGRPSYRLGSLVDEFELASDLDGKLQPHRATYDVLVTARLFVLLAGRRTLEELRDQPSGGAGDAEPALF